VNGTAYSGRNVVLATGSYAKTLPGLEIGGRIITSDRALTLDHVLQRVVILGGGVIGVEFASIFRSFGAEVTVVEALSRLLPNEDQFASKLLERAFRRRGIAAETGVQFTGAKQVGDAVVVSLNSGEDLEADLLLVAVGRGPNTTGQGYEKAGLATDRGSSSPISGCAPTSTASTPWVTSSLACSWPTGASPRAFVAEDIAGLEPRGHRRGRYSAGHLL